MAKNTKLEELLTDQDPAEKIAAVPFEQGLALLEELVTSVESGSLPLDKSMLSYERGVALIDHLRKKLSGAEEKLRLLQKEPAKK
jgi:exodeoxyribonuclease VII small subunit